MLLKTKSVVYEKINNHKIDLWRQRLLDFYFLITPVETLNMSLHDHHQWQTVVTASYGMGNFKD